MRIKKIPKRKRIKVSYTIGERFGLAFFDTWGIRTTIEQKFGMFMTSKNWGSMYFRVVDQQKFMLFKIAYSEFIQN